jgi:hypothetical protein
MDCGDSLLYPLAAVPISPAIRRHARRLKEVPRPTRFFSIKTRCTYWLFCAHAHSQRAHGCWCLRTPSPVPCFPLTTAWRGISTPMLATLSASCLPAPFAVSRSGRVSTRKRCGLVARIALALAERFAGAREGSACRIPRAHASEGSLFLREEEQEQGSAHRSSTFLLGVPAPAHRTSPSVTALPRAHSSTGLASGHSRDQYAPCFSPTAVGSWEAWHVFCSLWQADRRSCCNIRIPILL